METAIALKKEAELKLKELDKFIFNENKVYFESRNAKVLEVGWVKPTIKEAKQNNETSQIKAKTENIFERLFLDTDYLKVNDDDAIVVYDDFQLAK